MDQIKWPDIGIACFDHVYKKSILHYMLMSENDRVFGMEILFSVYHEVGFTVLHKYNISMITSTRAY